MSVPLRGEGTKAFHGFPWLCTVGWCDCNKTLFYSLLYTQLNSKPAPFEIIYSFSFFIWILPGFRITEVENIRNGGAGKINNLESSLQMQLVQCWNGNVQALFPKEAISTF